MSTRQWCPCEPRTSGPTHEVSGRHAPGLEGRSLLRPTLGAVGALDRGIEYTHHLPSLPSQLHSCAIMTGSRNVVAPRLLSSADWIQNNSTCVLSSGSADANTAARAAIHVQSFLRRDYDLLTD